MITTVVEEAVATVVKEAAAGVIMMVVSCIFNPNYSLLPKYSLSHCKLFHVTGY